MEDYKQKYYEALERAKDFMRKRGASPNEDAFECAKEFSETVFPELKESEDEKIRKELVGAFTATADKREHEIYGNGITYGQVLDWLEKQKDAYQRGVDDALGGYDPKSVDLSSFCNEIQEFSDMFEGKPKVYWDGWFEAEDEEMIDAIYADIKFTRNAHANEYNSQVYEEELNWLNSLKQRLKQDITPIVSIAEQDGEKGVRLCVGDVDIFIEAHDLDNSKEYDWDNAIARLKEIGKRTFDKREMHLIAAYIDEINEKLREIGGDELMGYYWASSERSATGAWAVNFSPSFAGYVYGSNKYYGSAVRPVADFKK